MTFGTWGLCGHFKRLIGGPVGRPWRSVVKKQIFTGSFPGLPHCLHRFLPVPSRLHGVALVTHITQGGGKIFHTHACMQACIWCKRSLSNECSGVLDPPEWPQPFRPYPLLGHRENGDEGISRKSGARTRGEGEEKEGRTRGEGEDLADGEDAGGPGARGRGQAGLTLGPPPPFPSTLAGTTGKSASDQVDGYAGAAGTPVGTEQADGENGGGCFGACGGVRLLRVVVWRVLSLRTTVASP